MLTHWHQQRDVTALSIMLALHTGSAGTGLQQASWKQRGRRRNCRHAAAILVLHTSGSDESCSAPRTPATSPSSLLSADGPEPRRNSMDEIAFARSAYGHIRAHIRCVCAGSRSTAP